MASKFVRFTYPSGEGECYLNPATVSIVEALQVGSLVTSTSGKTVSVAGTPREVCLRLTGRTEEAK